MTTNPPSAPPEKDRTMRATDVISYFVHALGPHKADAEGDPAEYQFESPFPFTVAVLSPDRIAITAPIPLPSAAQRASTLERLLEANLQGAETGPGALCLIGTGLIAYRDVIDLSGFDLQAIQLRFIDFSLYYEYWRSEGARLLDLDRDMPPDEQDLIRI
jgi:hypothetical protein